MKQGVVPALIAQVSQLTDPENGVLIIIAKNYDDIVASTDAKMQREEDRLSRLKRDLVSRYSNLESLLAELAGVQSSLEYHLSQLSS